MKKNIQYIEIESLSSLGDLVSNPVSSRLEDVRTERRGSIIFKIIEIRRPQNTFIVCITKIISNAHKADSYEKGDHNLLFFAAYMQTFIHYKVKPGDYVQVIDPYVCVEERPNCSARVSILVKPMANRKLPEVIYFHVKELIPTSQSTRVIRNTVVNNRIDQSSSSSTKVQHFEHESQKIGSVQITEERRTVPRQSEYFEEEDILNEQEASPPKENVPNVNTEARVPDDQRQEDVTVHTDENATSVQVNQKASVSDVCPPFHKERSPGPEHTEEDALDMSCEGQELLGIEELISVMDTNEEGQDENVNIRTSTPEQPARRQSNNISPVPSTSKKDCKSASTSQIHQDPKQSERCRHCCQAQPSAQIRSESSPHHSTCGANGQPETGGDQQFSSTEVRNRQINQPSTVAPQTNQLRTITHPTKQTSSRRPIYAERRRKYNKLIECKAHKSKYNTYAVLKEIVRMPYRLSSTSRLVTKLKIQDESLGSLRDFRFDILDNGMEFMPPLELGAVFRIHEMSVQVFNNEPDGRVYTGKLVTVVKGGIDSPISPISTKTEQELMWDEQDENRVKELREWYAFVTKIDQRDVKMDEMCQSGRYNLYCRLILFHQTNLGTFLVRVEDGTLSTVCSVEHPDDESQDVIGNDKSHLDIFIIDESIVKFLENLNADPGRYLYLENIICQETEAFQSQDLCSPQKIFKFTLNRYSRISIPDAQSTQCAELRERLGEDLDTTEDSYVNKILAIAQGERSFCTSRITSSILGESQFPMTPNKSTQTENMRGGAQMNSVSLQSGSELSERTRKVDKACQTPLRTTDDKDNATCQSKRSLDVSLDESQTNKRRKQDLEATASNTDQLNLFETDSSRTDQTSQTFLTASKDNISDDLSKQASGEASMPPGQWSFHRNQQRLMDNRDDVESRLSSGLSSGQSNVSPGPHTSNENQNVFGVTADERIQFRESCLPLVPYSQDGSQGFFTPPGSPAEKSHQNVESRSESLRLSSLSPASPKLTRSYPASPRSTRSSPASPRSTKSSPASPRSTRLSQVSPKSPRSSPASPTSSRVLQVSPVLSKESSMSAKSSQSPSVPSRSLKALSKQSSRNSESGSKSTRSKMVEVSNVLSSDTHEAHSVSANSDRTEMIEILPKDTTMVLRKSSRLSRNLNESLTASSVSGERESQSPISGAPSSYHTGLQSPGPSSPRSGALSPESASSYRTGIQSPVDNSNLLNINVISPEPTSSAISPTSYKTGISSPNSSTKTTVDANGQVSPRAAVDDVAIDISDSDYDIDELIDSGDDEITFNISKRYLREVGFKKKNVDGEHNSDLEYEQDLSVTSFSLMSTNLPTYTPPYNRKQTLRTPSPETSAEGGKEASAILDENTDPNISAEHLPENGSYISRLFSFFTPSGRKKTTSKVNQLRSSGESDPEDKSRNEGETELCHPGSNQLVAQTDVHHTETGSSHQVAQTDAHHTETGNSHLVTQTDAHHTETGSSHLVTQTDAHHTETGSSHLVAQTDAHHTEQVQLQNRSQRVKPGQEIDKNVTKVNKESYSPQRLKGRRRSDPYELPNKLRPGDDLNVARRLLKIVADPSLCDEERSSVYRINVQDLMDQVAGLYLVLCRVITVSFPKGDEVYYCAMCENISEEHHLRAGKKGFRCCRGGGKAGRPRKIMYFVLKVRDQTESELDLIVMDRNAVNFCGNEVRKSSDTFFKSLENSLAELQIQVLKADQEGSSPEFHVVNSYPNSYAWKAINQLRNVDFE